MIMVHKKHYSETGQEVRFVDASIVCSIRNAVDNPIHHNGIKEKISKIRIEKGLAKGSNNPNWKGGMMIRNDGYIYRYCPNHPFGNKSSNYMMEHRLVMEKHLGRYLKLEESIHHLDYDKSNNNIDNLHLFFSEKEHQAHHQMLFSAVADELKMMGLNMKVGQIV